MINSDSDAPREHRDASGHRIHADRSPANLQRRAFMTRLFGATAAVAFAGMLAACSDDSTSASSASSGRPGQGGPGEGAPPGGGSEGITDKFAGLTSDGTVIEDLYSIRTTGISTDDVVAAAAAWLKSLNAAQRKAVKFAIDPADFTKDEFRLWSNVDGYQRQGLSLADMTDQQKTLAMGILAAGLSAKGLENAETIVKLNQYAGELIGNTDQFNEGLYWFTVMGTPSATEPWGWQIDGRHLVINYFVLGDQVVMTPTFHWAPSR